MLSLTINPHNHSTLWLIFTYADGTTLFLAEVL